MNRAAFRPCDKKEGRGVSMVPILGESSVTTAFCLILSSFLLRPEWVGGIFILTSDIDSLTITYYYFTVSVFV